MAAPRYADVTLTESDDVHVRNVDYVNNASAATAATLSDAEVRAIIRDGFLSIVRDRQLSPAHQAVITCVFVVFIVVGALGNALVCLVVMRSAHMCNSRNIFIVNLAASDLTLCLITQPLNLIRLNLAPVWTLGEVACRLTALLPAINVFVSSLSISAIALDRLQVIVYSSKQLCCNCPLRPIVYIWVVSLFLASPMLIFPALLPVEPRGVFVFYTCVENPKLHYEKVALAYSLASTVFQYLLPITIVLFAYASICNKLRRRFLIRRWSRAHCDITPMGLIGQYPTNRNRRQQHRRSRVQRTYALLVAMTATFVLSWLPLNIVNIVADVDPTLLSSSIDNHAYLPAFCHLMVLASAVVNPLLYGWLNDNFHREFVDLWYSLGGANTPRPLSRDHSLCQSAAPQLIAPSPTRYNEAIALDDIIVISNDSVL